MPFWTYYNKETLKSIPTEQAMDHWVQVAGLNTATDITSVGQ
jgi:NADPH-dependent glutamate synthase beta subunit-like oxidoreductase